MSDESTATIDADSEATPPEVKPQTETEVSERDPDTGPEMKKVTILMPAWMHEELRRRARRRGVSVTELMRQAVSLDKILFDDPGVEVLLKKDNEIQKLVIAR